MDKEISLNIEFSRTLSEDEQTDFWDSLVTTIERMDLKAGGGHDSNQLEWIIDYSASRLDKGEIMERIGDFLMQRDEIILNFKIE